MIAINDPDKQQRYWTCLVSIALFSNVAGVQPTLIGYNFNSLFSVIMFLWELSMFYWMIHFYVGLIKLEKQYAVFRKKWYPHIFTLGYLLISLISSITVGFITIFVSNPDELGDINTHLNILLFVFVPLFFSYLIFCYYAYFNFFAKYTSNGKRSNKRNRNLN